MNHGEVMPGPGLETPIRAMETEQAEHAYMNQLRAMPEPMDELREVPHKYNPPTSQQLLSEYEIRIRFLAKGCVISVGCKELAFGSVDSAMTALQDYVNNPKIASDFWKGQFNMV